MSLEALVWVQNDSPAESPLDLAVLSALANNARADGTASCPGKRLIAKRARVSVETVKRALKSLEQRGLIRRGDQTITEGWHYRPTVYDLALELVREDEEHVDLYDDGPVDNSEIGAIEGGQVDPSQGGQIDPPPDEGGQISDRGGSPVTHKPRTKTPTHNGGRSVTGPRESDDAPPVDNSSGTPPPAGADEHGPLSPFCPQHPTGTSAPCAACLNRRERFDRAEIKRAAARRRAQSQAEIQASRRRRAETAGVDSSAHGRQARELLAAQRGSQ